MGQSQSQRYHTLVEVKFQNKSLVTSHRGQSTKREQLTKNSRKLDIK
jgi:hypothetical protein